MFANACIVVQTHCTFAVHKNASGFYHIQNSKKMIGKKVLIRSYSAGVFFGKLESEKYTPSGKVVVLSNSRRIHYWQGAASLSQVSQEGIKEGRVAMLEPIKEVVGVIETTLLSESAISNLENQKVWKA